MLRSAVAIRPSPAAVGTTHPATAGAMLRAVGKRLDGARTGRAREARHDVLGGRPGQRVERQAEAHRRVARNQEHVLAPEEPRAADPAGSVVRRLRGAAATA